MRRRAGIVTAIAAGVVALAGATVGRDYARGASLVVLAARIHGWPRAVASWRSAAVHDERVRIPSRHGPLAAHLYRPDGGIRRAIVVLPGVHAGAIDEPRLVDFAGHLASRGFAVVTVELPDLKRYEVTPRSTDMIEDATRWTAGRADLASDGRVGMLGISFGGGLTIVAAGRPALRDHVAYAVSFGGHGDLPRTLRYLCTGVLPDGSRHPPPHDYGVAIILLGVADRLVPPDQVDTLRRGIRTFLEASHVDMLDKPRARTIFDRARAMAADMPEPARTLMQYVNDRDVKALGPRLLPHVAAFGGDPALSPVRSPAPTAPVYLLHGMDDNVIPSIESVLLAEYLRSVTEVHLLRTPLITHAQVDRPADVAEIWKLISFWTDVLDE